jgi:hypothetical protein
MRARDHLPVRRNQRLDAGRLAGLALGLADVVDAYHQHHPLPAGLGDHIRSKARGGSGPDVAQQRVARDALVDDADTVAVGGAQPRAKQIGPAIILVAI